MAEKWEVQESNGSYWICDTSHLNQYNEHPEIGMAYKEKHARLFAASQRLLKALESLERTAGLPAASDDPARVEARAAIAAAKGE
jgi:hypothetical protein